MTNQAREPKIIYRITTAVTTHNLTSAVQQLLDDGWSLQGGPFVIPGDPYGRPPGHPGHHLILTVIGQAMVKRDA